jgi:quercetin dioxygenase-like cupin family protein/nucleoid DNA-binding protein
VGQWNPDLGKKQVRQVVDDTLNTIQSAIKKTGKVRLKGIGTITTRKKPAQKGGKLVDTTLGETVPEGAELELPPSAETMERLKTPPAEKMAECYAPKSKMIANPNSPLAHDGVTEAGVIGEKQTRDGFAPGPITGWWDHGFALRQLTMETGATIPVHTRAEQEVIFVQEGTLELVWADGTLIMGAGDTLSVPIGLPHGFRNPASALLTAFIIRGSDDPAAPEFVEPSAAAE